MVGLEAEDRERHAGLGVEVALGLVHVEVLSQDRRDHLLGRRLAVAARDRNHQRLHAPERVRGERVKRRPCVRDEDFDDAGRNFGLSFHDHRRGASRDRVIDELGAVHLLAAQREEDTARLHLARVGVEGRERFADLGAAYLATPGRLEDLEETQSHLDK